MQLFSGRNSNANKEQIEKIILENYNQYYRLAYSYVHNEADANDIVQNGAYKAIKNSATLKKAEFATTWIYRIMLNECFQYVRQPKHISFEDMLEETGVEMGGREDTYANVDLQRALDALPKKDKAIIILKYFEDKRLEEIAEILNENINTVKSRLYRSMKKLRSVLEENLESDFGISNKRAGELK